MNLRNIFIIMVLYKCKLEDSESLRSLDESIQSPMPLMVYDNSPIRQSPNDNFILGKFNIHYYHDASNPGIGPAYNFALGQATSSHSDWLLLLDQDTHFDKYYFKQLEKIETSVLTEDVVAIIPKVFSRQSQSLISPCRMYLGGLARPVDITPGVIEKRVSAINSGTILSVPFLSSIQGFPMDFSMDMVDHWYFRKIYTDKKKIYLLDSAIYQNLSVIGDFETNVTHERYQKLLSAECLFIKDEHVLGKILYKFRLIFRTIKQLGYKDKSYFKTSIKQLFGV